MLYTNENYSKLKLQFHYVTHIVLRHSDCYLTPSAERRFTTPSAECNKTLIPGSEMPESCRFLVNYTHLGNSHYAALPSQALKYPARPCFRPEQLYVRAWYETFICNKIYICSIFLRFFTFIFLNIILISTTTTTTTNNNNNFISVNIKSTGNLNC